MPLNNSEFNQLISDLQMFNNENEECWLRLYSLRRLFRYMNNEIRTTEDITPSIDIDGITPVSPEEKFACITKENLQLLTLELSFLIENISVKKRMLNSMIEHYQNRQSIQQRILSKKSLKNSMSQSERLEMLVEMIGGMSYQELMDYGTQNPKFMNVLINLL